MIRVNAISQQNSLVKIEFLETIKVFNGELCHIDYHQERYERTLRSFGIKDFIELQEVLLPPKKGLYRCRVVYGLNSQLTQHYYRYEKREIKQLKLIESETISYEKKYANREELDELFLKRGECDDIIIVKMDS